MTDLFFAGSTPNEREFRRLHALLADSTLFCEVPDLVDVMDDVSQSQKEETGKGLGQARNRIRDILGAPWEIGRP